MLKAQIQKLFRKKNDINAILFSIQTFAEFMNIITTAKDCRDARDNFLLALAIDGKADYLITGDDDLLSMKKIKKTEIIKIVEFFDIVSTIR